MLRERVLVPHPSPAHCGFALTYKGMPRMTSFTIPQVRSLSRRKPQSCVFVRGV